MCATASGQKHRQILVSPSCFQLFGSDRVLQESVLGRSPQQLASSIMPTREDLSMKRWRLAVIIVEISLFAFILVLPQVALPDFTAQSGVSVGAAQAHRFSVTPGLRLEFEPLTTSAGTSEEGFWNRSFAIYFSPPSSRLSLLCALIC